MEDLRYEILQGKVDVSKQEKNTKLDAILLAAFSPKQFDPFENNNDTHPQRKNLERVLIGKLQSERESWWSKKSPTKSTNRAIWGCIKQQYQDPIFISELKTRWKALQMKLHRAEKRTCGISKRGLFLSSSNAEQRTSAPKKLEMKLDQYWGVPAELRFVPHTDERRISPDNLARLQSLDDKLVARLRGGNGPAANKKPDARDSNRGTSLAKTVVSGGRYSNLARGISGTIHNNGNILDKASNMNSQEAIESAALQQEIYDVITDVIWDAFKDRLWFQGVMRKLESIDRQRLMPVAGRSQIGLPVSHVWYSCDPGLERVHTDSNAIPPAFVFCPQTVTGGELIVQYPDEPPKRIKTDAGVIVGGCWAQFPHCNAEVKQGDRRSFVVYLDHRVLSTSYIYKG